MDRAQNGDVELEGSEDSVVLSRTLNHVGPGFEYASPRRA